MDQDQIIRLRILLIKDAVGGEQERSRLLDEIYPIIGELLALADAGLKIHKACNSLTVTGALERAVQIGGIALSAMREFDILKAREKQSHPANK